MSSQRCWAEIDLAALRHNAGVARQHAGRNASLLAVIKANGYGHGLAAVAQALAKDADMFGVANLQEAMEARGFVPHPVLILGPALPAERPGIVEHSFIPTVSSHTEAQEFSRLASKNPIILSCKIDTGMGRMGIAPDRAIAELKAISQLQGVIIHSVSTHLPSADEDEAYTRAQLSRFTELIAQIRREVPGAYRVHALQSAGVLAFGSGAVFDIVRAGLMLYGVAPLPAFQEQLIPTLALKSRVVLLRELPAGHPVSYGRTFITQRTTRVATLGIGYADGIPRAISNRGAAVLIGGQRCPLLGRVTMDLIMVDVTEVADLSVGAEAVLIGKQADEEITAREIADWAQTIAWEIFTGIGSRVERVYLNR